jgi:predicted  nucleic acid-binding Zn-ribbon protein
MIWSAGKKLVFISAFALLFSLPVLSQSASPSPKVITISEKDYQNMRDRVLLLQISYQSLKLRVQNLQSSSQELMNQLDDLRIELQTSQSLIIDLSSDIKNLKTQLGDSLKKSRELGRTLIDLENNYKSLHESFLAYQKAAEKEIKAEKAKATIAIIIAWVSGLASILFGSMYLLEHFFTK